MDRQLTATAPVTTPTTAAADADDVDAEIVAILACAPDATAAKQPCARCLALGPPLACVTA